MPSDEIVFLGGARTPFGTFLGTLRELTATELGALAGREAMKRAGVEPGMIDHTIVGNVIQSAADGIYIGRHVALSAGVPVEKPGYCVNRMCASGFQAVVSGAKEILTGDAQFVLAVGTENMSLTPHLIRNSRTGIGLFQAPMEDGLYNALTDRRANVPMGITAENLAEKYDLHREAIDAFAALSQKRAMEAWESGRLAEECFPVEVKQKRKAVLFERDEHIRADSTEESLAKLRPVFKEGGVVTAGNASGINDGAAALVVASRGAAEKRGLKPIGRLVAWGVSGCQPEIMGIGPAESSRIALRKAGLTLQDMDLVEINEAFSAQYLAVEKELGLDRSKTNVNGGAIAIGHPVGASGARLTLTLLHELRRRKARYGLAGACIGGGMGLSIIVEALKN
ncbi:MAG: acetyl-CoA C-acetyltransferase [Candidatus Tectomicrobia bacterium]|uniref:Acetyl-CoA C-acetyltransferase n=1 Tax=Tectimicrobiota bacterium TaxID=2528274 RepID=A0A932MS10_UNCTE|nr:acetyl-CoA C-acetyltransferase [Candidatus Tectomicrobia bacterium]